MIDVIILAAGSIKNKLHFANFIFNSPALIPINVRSSVSYILDFYKLQNVRLHLVINEEDKEIIEKEIKYYNNINFILIKNSKSVIDTLFQSLNFFDLDKEVIINISTTIPTVMPQENSIYIENEPTINADWSAIKNLGQENFFIYKDTNQREICNAFTGLFRCEIVDLRIALNENLEEKDLLKIIESMNKRKKLNIEKCEWIDCGHELNFYDAKAKLISSRSFNAIEIEQITGVIKKSSKNIIKFKNEIKYIEQLPKDVSLFFPSILSDIVIKDDIASVEMEYYGYNTLAEYLLYWDLKNYSWNKIFKSLEFVLNKFNSYKYSIGKEAYINFIYEKTINRVNIFQNQLGVESNLFNNSIKINGKEYKGINILRNDIKSRVLKLYNENDFCVMHGDFCFNNILYDIKSGIIRLIDARGSFGDTCVGIYGDIKYDLAKLSHSIIGSYDFIVNNLFYVKYDNGFEYEIVKRDNYEYLYELNVELIEELGYKKSDILFLMGLLFVSMCPLHLDDHDRQIVMYLHGLKYINENLE